MESFVIKVPYEDRNSNSNRKLTFIEFPNRRYNNFKKFAMFFSTVRLVKHLFSFQFFVIFNSEVKN